ncbi:MAG TPA: SRPBCC domain-containing protein [Casimicrobiaceae bacterium]|nr:SRPBCC domain-containing protein [Casimicrobiaceae bacterium]
MAANAIADLHDTTPAIVVDVVVPCPPDRAFHYFTRDIGRWWPLKSHSLGMEHAVDVRFETGEGGRLFEVARDGRERSWGTVTTWEPGRRVAFTWHLDRDASTAQHVDVTFAQASDGTRVTLTHGGWHRREDGASARESYVGGWQFVLRERFGGYCVEAVDNRTKNAR